MTAEEEALELVNKFTYEISGIDKYNYCLDSHIRFTAKQCALITVYEIIKAIPDASDDDSPYNHELVWWQEVKQEIEKL